MQQVCCAADEISPSIARARAQDLQLSPALPSPAHTLAASAPTPPPPSPMTSIPSNHVHHLGSEAAVSAVLGGDGPGGPGPGL